MQSTSDRTSSGNGSLLVPVATAAASALAAWGVYAYLSYDERWWWKRRSRSPLEVCNHPNWEIELIHGTVAPGWQAVREEFVQNFRARGELGAALCIYHKGEKVVDLWGGYKDREQQQPWEEDTMVPIFSTTKGIAAFAVLIQESRGKLDADEKVSKYWPDFAQHGKEDVTVAQLIDHSVGLAGIDPPLTMEMLQHPDSRIVIRDWLAKAKMEWPNVGDYKGYMAIILGFYESVLVQVTDESERTIGKYLRDEAFCALDIEDEIYIGVPDSVAEAKIAKLDAMTSLEMLWATGTWPEGFITNIMLHPKSYTGRALRNPKLAPTPSCMDYDRRDVQRLELPASGGVATARAVATMYRAAERGIHNNKNSNKSNNNPLGLSPKALDRCLQPATPGRYNGWIDEVLGVEICMGAGFLLPVPALCSNEEKEDSEGISGDNHKNRGNNSDGRFAAVPNGFGTFGAGGSFAYCDPEAEIAYAYVMNRCGQVVIDDPREFAMRSKMYQIVQELRLKTDESPLDLEAFNAPHYLSKRFMEAHPELAPL